MGNRELEKNQQKYGRMGVAAGRPIPHSHDSPFPIADSQGRGGVGRQIPHSRLPIPKGGVAWGGRVAVVRARRHSLTPRHPEDIVRSPARSLFVLVALALLAPRIHAQTPADSQALDSIHTGMAVSVVSTGEVTSDSIRLIASLLRANGASESRARVVAASVVRHARSQSIDPLLLVGVIGVENPHLDIRARAHDGSVGVMQVQPFWRKHITGCGDDLRNADVNVCYGTRILRMAIDSSDSLTEALRRYNGCRGKSERCTRYTNAVFSRAGRALLLARSTQDGAR